MRATQETSRKVMNDEQFIDYEPQRKALKEYTEKSALRRAAWCVAIPCIVFFVVSLLWGSAVILLLSNFGIGSEKAVKILTEPAALTIISVAISLLCFTVPFIIACVIAGEKVSVSAGFIKPKEGTLLPCFLLGLGFCSFANIAVAYAGNIFESFGFNYSVPESEDPKGLFGFLLVLISTAVVPAIAEEFAFRGVVISLLKPFGEGFAVIASASVFGLVHGNFDQMFFAFLVGLVLGFVRIKTGSITVCMAIHFANNLVAVILSHFKNLPLYMSNTIYTIYLIIALLLAVLGVALLKEKNIFSFKEYDGVMEKKKIYKRYCFSVPTLILIIIYLFRAVSYINI